MKNKSSRRTFLQTGLVLPAAGVVISPSILKAAFQQPPVPGSTRSSGKPDTGKYGKYVIKEPYKKHHQLECVSLSGEELMADCIITHQVFYKPEFILKSPHSHDFVEIISLLGTNPMNCREFDAEIEWCLGEEREKHIINVPTVIPMAKGLIHGPIEITKINKPFIFLEVMLTGTYGKPKPA